MAGRIICLFIVLFFTTISVFSKVTIIETFRGWNNCVEISNSDVRVIISPQSGGRVLHYSLYGKNILFEDSNFDGYMLDDFRKDRHWPDGARFDIGPETIPGKLRDEPFMGEWDCKVIDEYSVELIYASDNMLGLHLKRCFRLDESSAKLYINQVSKNYSDEDISRHFWGRYFCKGGGQVVLPLKGNESWGYMGNYKSDSKVTYDEGKLYYDVSDETVKIGCNSSAGWISYIYDSLKFNVTFKVIPEMDYTSTQGYTTIFYTNGQVCEIEPVSPLYKLSPGESFVFEQVWNLEKMEE